MKRLNLDAAVWSAVLFLLLYTFTRMIYNGDIRNFIHPEMVKYSIFGTAAIAVMLIYNLMNIFKAGHSEEIKYGYILFLIPVVIYLFLKPAELSESSAINRGVNLMFYKGLNTEEDYHDHSHAHGDGDMLIENDNIIFNNDNFFTTIKEIYGHLEDYNDKSVIIKGFVVKEKDIRDSFLLSRMVVSCCAADTEIIGIRSQYNKSSSIKGGQWVEVKGRFKQAAKGEAPVLVVEKVKTIERPKDSYLYRD
ncbi:TIGR03943 family putative permease subunit [Clostridium thermarum]|uniref:TIGR03943 family putative permease subunit n=1 Tax=Clostridium thermarum TaxID=1716543 RepID=UPI0013D591D0|nr:TIGR03943 family protein [Clostridium thermarum]